MPSLTPGAFYFFSCGDFLFCRFSSNFRDLDYVGENAHDLFTVYTVYTVSSRSGPRKNADFPRSNCKDDALEAVG